MKHDPLQGLNEDQLSAVSAGGGPTLILAGAGSGKTRVLTRRAAWLMSRGVPPSSICLLTFTHRAAENMAEQITALGIPHVEKLCIGTFHAEAVRVLRSHAHLLGWPEHFAILEPQDAERLMKESMEDVLGPSRGGASVKVWKELYERCVQRAQSLETTLEERAPEFLPYIEVLQTTFSRYMERKAAICAMDFLDLLLGWRRIIVEKPDGGAYAERFEHVLVDEYQDVNPLQAEITDALSAHHRNLMVVGDDSQSIYGFRGADVQQILHFPQRHPNARVYRLELNYRSTAAILGLANTSIQRNEFRHPKTLRAWSEGGERPVVISCSTEKEEAAFVVQRIRELIEKEGVSPDDIAVLYRSHRRSTLLQGMMNEENLPYALCSGLPFFEKAHVKDLLALLRWVENPLDRASGLRALKLLPGVGAGTAEKFLHAIQTAPNEPFSHALMRALKQYAWRGRAKSSLERVTECVLEVEASSTDPGEAVKSLVEGWYGSLCLLGRDRATERGEDLGDLVSFAAREASLCDVMARVALLCGGAEQVLVGDTREGAVTLTTIHRSKGLEWKIVFVLGLAEGIFPLEKARESQHELEEERRLFYVAVTRAAKRLYLCRPSSGRSREGFWTGFAPSMFLTELGWKLGEGGCAWFDVWNVSRPR